MSTVPTKFEASGLISAPIRDLGLSLDKSRLQPVIDRFDRELKAAGLEMVKPRYYLSTEWGVPFGTVAIAIPFYLASAETLRLHAERVGYIEGFSDSDILRYLRHEMGHVVNYAYRLYDDEVWVRLFGPITRPYFEEYRPEPFSQDFVRHLPGWYAQKHPDEDWAETFAVWLTPGERWKSAYADWPIALAKLQYCDGTMERLRRSPPLVTDDELDEDVSEVAETLEQWYGRQPPMAAEIPPGLDGALLEIFDDLGEATGDVEVRPAAALIERIHGDLISNVFRWTGQFPERTRIVVKHLAQRADAMSQVYRADRETSAILAITTLVTALAMTPLQRASLKSNRQP